MKVTDWKVDDWFVRGGIIGRIVGMTENGRIVTQNFMRCCDFHLPHLEGDGGAVSTLAECERMDRTPEYGWCPTCDEKGYFDMRDRLLPCAKAEG